MLDISHKLEKVRNPRNCAFTQRYLLFATMLTLALSIIAVAAVVAARPQRYESQPFAKAVRARQAPTNVTGLEVDLGYAIYQGTANASTNLNIFKG